MVDLYATNGPAVGLNGTYSGYLYGREAEKIIENHPIDTPLFMYYAFHINHAPLEAPKKYLDMYANVTNPTRKAYMAMTSFMDESLYNLTNALKRRNMWNK